MMRQTLFLLLSCLMSVSGCSRSVSHERATPVAEQVPPPATATASSGGELSPQARLRKLSFHLRGVAPSADDYRALGKAIQVGQLEAFFQSKTREYIASHEYVGKMIDRLDELFRLRTAAGLPETRLAGAAEIANPSLAGFETLNAMDLLFEDMVLKNQSWDALLLSREYRIPSAKPISGGSASDRDFLGSVAPQVALPPMAPGQPTQPTTEAQTFLSVPFDSADPRIAGAITTARFFSRYNTTNVNRSRGRAAAIFRTFLCDDMRAVVEPKAGEDDDLLKKAFPKPKPDGWHSTAALANADKHGTEASCMACHYKLDPMGRSFFTTGSTLSEDAAPGALIYKGADGKMVNIKSRGLGDIANALVQRPEYVSCQVTHFWRWFVRSDEMPTTARLGELTAEFNRLGRRSNDFVAYLVNQKEFYTNDESSFVSLQAVRPMVDRCTNCHTGIRIHIPNFLKFPIDGGAKSHEYWVTRIVKRLDLAHGGAHRTMPPVESAWQPSREELGLFRRWVEGGVRDEDGKPTIDSKLAHDLIQPEGL